LRKEEGVFHSVWSLQAKPAVGEPVLSANAMACDLPADNRYTFSAITMNTSHHTVSRPNGKLTVGLISNPHSGRNRKQLDAIDRIVADYPDVHHRLTQDAGEIPGVLSGFARQPIDVLAVNGGDGTIARILTHLLTDSPFPTLPRLALLPGGTTNMNAGDVGLRGNLVKAVRRLCEWSSGRHTAVRTLQRPVLQVTGGDGQAAVCGMFFGAGAIIQGIEYCRANVHTKGVSNEIGPGLAMLRTVWGIARRDRRFLQSVNMSVQRNEKPADPTCDVLILLVSSLERLFLGMRPYWGRETAPLHTTLVLDNADRFLRTLPSLLRGRPTRHTTEANAYYSHNTDRLRLSMDGMWTLDGELYRATVSNGPVTITSGGDVTFVRL
jgi:hypothetical protein